jgi:hypothetical protein
MNKLKPGDYVVTDYTDIFGSKNIRVVRLDPKKIGLDPAHIERGTRTTFEGVLAGEKGKPYTKKQPDRVWLHGAVGAVLPMKDLRVPDAPGQERLRAYDEEITKLEGRVAELQEAKRQYAVDHRLEWDMPEFSDFDAFRKQ